MIKIFLTCSQKDCKVDKKLQYMDWKYRLFEFKQQPLELCNERYVNQGLVGLRPIYVINMSIGMIVGNIL